MSFGARSRSPNARARARARRPARDERGGARGHPTTHVQYSSSMHRPSRVRGRARGRAEATLRGLLRARFGRRQDAARVARGCLPRGLGGPAPPALVRTRDVCIRVHTCVCTCVHVCAYVYAHTCWKVHGGCPPDCWRRLRRTRGEPGAGAHTRAPGSAGDGGGGGGKGAQPGDRRGSPIGATRTHARTHSTTDAPRSSQPSRHGALDLRRCGGCRSCGRGRRARRRCRVQHVPRAVLPQGERRRSRLHECARSGAEVAR